MFFVFDFLPVDRVVRCTIHRSRLYRVIDYYFVMNNFVEKISYGTVITNVPTLINFVFTPPVLFECKICSLSRIIAPELVDFLFIIADLLCA